MFYCTFTSTDEFFICCVVVL